MSWVSVCRNHSEMRGKMFYITCKIYIRESVVNRSYTSKPFTNSLFSSQGVGCRVGEGISFDCL